MDKKTQWRVEAILSEIGVDRHFDLESAIQSWKKAAILGDEWALVRLQQLSKREEFKDFFTPEDESLLAGNIPFTFLIVEDDIAVRQEINRNLATFGHSILTAGDGELALNLLNNEIIQGLFLDLKVPKKDGFAILSEIKRLQLPIKVVVCTGYANAENLERLKAYPIVKVLSKPFFAETIIDAAKLVLM